MNDTELWINTCNNLLSGELSAIETYHQALDQFADSPDRAILWNILEDHEDNADQLREQILAMGGLPDENSGAWGAFATAVEGSAGLLVNSAALLALIEGEEHGRNEYEAALDDPDVSEEAKSTIGELLLSRQIEHITVLNNLRVAA
jgi:bacterioferritin (cytochrome b1)